MAVTANRPKSERAFITVTGIEAQEADISHRARSLDVRTSRATVPHRPGVRAMLTNLGPLHAIAARRGDGLRPELARLLVRDADALTTASGETKMSREDDNKALVGRWFAGFWGNPWNPQIIDELAAPDMLLQ